MNLRVIKKDIIFLTNDFLGDALIALNFRADEARQQSVLEVVNAVIDLQDETISKIAHPDPEVKPRKYYRELAQNFVVALDAQYDRHRTLIQGN